MQTIGLLGGATWPSTIDYYRSLNEIISRSVGAGHSAELLLRSIDYTRLKRFYPDRWDEVAAELLSMLKELDQSDLCCIVICNNTLHKAFDLLEGKGELRAPVVHIVDAAVELLQTVESKRPLLLATKFTMEDTFYVARLQHAGFDPIVPNEQHREQIHAALIRLSTGEDPMLFGATFESLIVEYKGCDSVLLACTELPGVFRGISPLVPVLDPSERQCQIAVEYSLGIR